MQIELTEGEANALKQLIHFAVQARGMEVAEAGVVLVKKIDAAATAAMGMGKSANGPIVFQNEQRSAE